MRASQTVLPFKLTASDESLTAHAGLVLFDEYLGYSVGPRDLRIPMIGDNRSD
jgi:hypothetical protein